MPRETSQWPFGLIDLHVVIAATGLGFGLARWNYDLFRMGRSPVPGTSWGGVVAFVSIFSPIMLSWSLGMVVLRWRGPAWKSRRRLMREPGFVASVAAWVGLGIYLVTSGLVLLAGPPRRFRDPSSMLPYVVGASVVLGWTSLAIQGRWHPCPGWVDRAGRYLGYGWIALFALGWLRFN